MTNQTKSLKRLAGSPTGTLYRLSTLTLAAILTVGVSATAQNQPDSKTPAAPKVEKKIVTVPAEKIIGGYNVHQMVELGGRVTDKSGSSAMWATMVNQGTGVRLLQHSLEMRTNKPSKTPFFDNLSTASFGYGGDPNDVSTLNLNKGRLYDFAGSFRRDRNYFDYNLFVNSLLGPAALVPEPNSLHLFNTVRRNTDTMLTLFPVSVVHFRAGYNHGTNEGPTYSSVHNGGDVQLLQWFRNSIDTFTAGLDVSLARRTTLSYDQFYAFYKGDSPFQLTGANYKLSDGTRVSLGVDTLASATCGSGSQKTPEVVSGIVNPYCSATITQNQSAPTRTTFPTEQVRFASHYWNKVAMNGRVTYSGGISNVNNFNETFVGLLSRTFMRQEIDTGGLGGGRLAHNRRINVNADYGVEAELNKHFALSDAITYWDFRNEGLSIANSVVWAGTAASSPNLLTPVSSLTPASTSTQNNFFLNQKNIGNAVVGIVTMNSQFKFSGGWRFNSRNIADTGDDLTWHQNWLLLGTVFQPKQGTRITLNYDQMSSKSANSQTPSNTYTREAPNKTYHLRGRATAKVANWINFSMTGNGFWGKNDDPLVNHLEHNYDLSFASQIVANDSLSFDLAVSHDDVYSRTDMCYLYSGPVAPYGDPGSVGTCLQTTTNPGGTLPTAAATSQLRLGNGYYSAPSTFFSGTFNYAPTRRVKLSAGARVNDVAGQAELLNPYQVPGALQSTILSPFADVQFNIAPQWIWHGNWNRQAYYETDGGPAPRSFQGDIVTLGVKYAF